ncbi:MAG: KEOPS complex N(6)-L-threonylcarbamoyladenine synthase Kae1 [Candidatus Aenigmarchaeota archaeon]|nr:KEOPS complex N(6)-L-threonylcarbamoyladenine synthase Kae1 [Candidatus Aenigmarchaeota archaeon]MDW8149209.1 KEOPS complex N(6)-L-threonylcarbamoyladenine synthase Kae1 [Candidatus Aenigmarchaeota archaeon]
MICLGIEGTAHTFGVGIVDDEKILANEKAIYKPEIGKGIVPNEAAIHHEKIKEEILKNALEKANVKLKDVDIISYSAGPGLPPTLSVTSRFVHKLSEEYKKPLIPVNHAVAHLEIGRLTTKIKDPIFVYLSGGNSQIISFIEGRYRILGETLDIPIGNCLDVVAREMKLPMPGGREIEKLAKNGKYIKLPYLVKGMDFSFSGVATYAIKLIKEGYKFEDIAFSLQETCFSMIIEVSERALAHTNKNEVLLVGGVASNKRLQEMFDIMCRERNAVFKVVDEEFAADNGAMIAYCGLLHYKNSCIPKLKSDINHKWRIDEVDICWFTKTLNKEDTLF